MSNVYKIPVLLIGYSLLLFSWFSCNSSNNQVERKQALSVDFYLRYLQSDKQVKAEISFSEVDATKKIMPKKMEEVLFQQKALDGKKVLNRYRYQLTTQADLSETYRFEYSLDEEVLQQQDISIIPIINFSIKKEKVSKSAGTTFTYQGQPLQDNEQLIVLFSDENNKTITVKISSGAPNEVIPILPVQVNNLGLGKGTVYVVRKQVIKSTNDNTHLEGQTEYYSEVKTFEVIE